MANYDRRRRWLGQPEVQDTSSATAATLASRTTPSGPDITRPTVESETTAAGRHWAQVSAGWPIQNTSKLGRLVVPTGNADAPVHRWFHLKEAYSKDLLAEVLTLVPGAVPRDRRLNLVDPFSGVGTTMLSAVDMVRDGLLSGLTGYGMEINPFLHFVAKTKTRSAISNANPDAARLAALVRESNAIEPERSDYPTLSTFANNQFFPPRHVEQLVKLRLAIERADDLDQLNRDWARFALAMAVEPASRLRRDGRTLRYENREPLAPGEVFVRALTRIADDLSGLDRASEADVQISLASAIGSGWKAVPSESVDLVLFSPPYPNNIDYTEVYKTELWALAFVDNHGDFREQRHATVRSHPSVKFRRGLAYQDDPRAGDVEKLLNPVIAEIPAASRYARPLARMIEGYADDMLHTFDAAYKALRPGGYCVYVVGNSVHGTTNAPVMIASDVMLGRLAEIAGLSVETVHVARSLPRRRIASGFVRESVVVLKKDD